MRKETLTETFSSWAFKSKSEYVKRGPKEDWDDEVTIILSGLDH